LNPKGVEIESLKKIITEMKDEIKYKENVIAQYQKPKDNKLIDME